MEIEDFEKEYQEEPLVTDSSSKHNTFYVLIKLL